MINMKPVLSVASAETRVIRRLVRYWIFLAFAYLLVIIAFLYYSAIHGLYSTHSATVGLISPRFLVSIMGLYYLMIYAIGVVFLAFDVRARDQRERVAEVMDSRPYTNLELVAGRFLGVLIATWIPILVLSILLPLLGLLLKGVGSPIGEPVELTGLLTFTFLMAIPALSFVIAVVFLITLLVRNRLVSAILLLIIFGLSFWGMVDLPIYKGRLLDYFGILHIKFPSDISALLINFDGFLQRGAILLASLGILGIAAAVHPRLDDGSRPRLAFSGGVIVVIAAVIIGYIYNKDVKDLETQSLWLEAHSAYSNAVIPDMQKVNGRVNITPGKNLELDINITFRAPDTGPVKNAIFTLNPGQKVKEVLSVSGKPLDFTHNNGLLDITLYDELLPGEEIEIKLSIEGVPENNFSYLDSVSDPRTIKASNANISLLGEDSALFNSKFVALMPAVRWLPVSGPENNRDDPRMRSVDYFNVELDVRLPKGWLVAGPGRRRSVEEKEEYNIFRFSPPSVVPEVALIASEFESRSFETDNVLMELLVHKRHMKNIEVLAETGDKVKEWVGDRMKEAKESGLEYPYDGLTLVEVPTTLKGYGGGWRLDTVQTLPGVFLLRELSLPTARFDSAFRNPDDFKDKEDGMAQAMWERLQIFFQNDFSGGNVLTGVSRNFLLYQTSAAGPDSLALNFVMETLSGLLIADTKGYFSAHMYLVGTRINTIIENVLISFLQGRGIGETVSNATIKTMTNRPAIWERGLEESLKDMDPWKDPEDAVDVLALKGYAISDSIYKILGREKTAELLSIIRNNHRGKSFKLEDMIEAGKSLGYDLEELLGDWTGSTNLPGFVVTETEGFRIQDDENGNPRYQLLFTVRNDEPAPGLFRFVYYYAGESAQSGLTESEAIKLSGRSAIQYGTIVSRLPNSYHLSPYFALNRDTFKIKMGSIDHEKIINREPLEGTREISWEIPFSESIIVDDLDENFTVVEEDDDKGFQRLETLRSSDIETDQGLPYEALNSIIRGRPVPEEWSRMSNGTAWGKYRHTTAVIESGDGSKKAVFSASLPVDGEWDLEFHMPAKSIVQRRDWGKWNITVRDSNGDQQEVKFDSKAGSEGWNLADKLNLPKGEVTVEISNKTDGDFVVADAIRWSPSAG